MSILRLPSSRFRRFMGIDGWVVASGKLVRGEALPLAVQSFGLEGGDLILQLAGGKSIVVAHYQVYIPSGALQYNGVPERVVIETLVPRRAQVPGGEWANDVLMPEAVLQLEHPGVRVGYERALEEQRLAKERADEASRLEYERLKQERLDRLVVRLNNRLGGQATVVLTKAGIELRFSSGVVLPINVDVECDCGHCQPAVSLDFPQPDGVLHREDTYPLPL